MNISTQPDFLSIVIPRNDIEAGDISSTVAALAKLLNPEAALKYCEKVDIGVCGYDDYAGELNELPEVRNFVSKLDAEFPYWCYFLSKRALGLGFIFSCFCPPFLPPKTREKVWLERIGGYLTKRGFPAMNHICAAAGCSEPETERMTNRVMKYITDGPDRCAAVTSSAETVQVWPEGRSTKLRDLIRQLYTVVAALEEEFEGRKFTPDGHLVGSIGEVVAAYAFNLKLLPASNATHDAEAPDGTLVQIKLTGGERGVSIYSEPKHLLVLQLINKTFTTVYNGRGSVVWEKCRAEAKNGQRSVALSTLRRLDKGELNKLPQVNPFPVLNSED
jgi:hypothetical protein